MFYIDSTYSLYIYIYGTEMIQEVALCYISFLVSEFVVMSFVLKRCRQREDEDEKGEKETQT